MPRAKKIAVSTAITSADVLAALRKRYSMASGWALLQEVRNSTGYAANRAADAIAVGLWPSRGMEIHGFEVKVSRHDWIRERDRPAKAEAIASKCDRWWLVVSDRELVRDGELPPTWGLLVLEDGTIVTGKEAEKLDRKPLDVGFLAAMLRRAAENEERTLREHVSPEEVQRRIEAALAEEDADQRERWEREAQQELLELRRIGRWAEHFKKTAGVDITQNYWAHGPIGKIVELIAHRSMYGEKLLTPGEVLRNTLAREEKALVEAIEKIRGAREDLEQAIGKADAGSDAA